MKNIFNKIFRRNKYDIVQMMINGQIPSFKEPLTHDQKLFLVNACVEAVMTPLMFSFYTCELQTHIESEIVNDADGARFRLTFEKINIDQECDAKNKQ